MAFARPRPASPCALDQVASGGHSYGCPFGSPRNKLTSRQHQLPRSGPNGQPIESSHLALLSGARLQRKGARPGEMYEEIVKLPQRAEPPIGDLLFVKALLLQPAIPLGPRMQLPTDGALYGLVCQRCLSKESVIHRVARRNCHATIRAFDRYVHLVPPHCASVSTLNGTGQRPAQALKHKSSAAPRKNDRAIGGAEDVALRLT
jgi:hypothetical protein